MAQFYSLFYCFQQHQLAELGKKQIEQTMQQLQEQLQLNIIQQTHILQSTDKKKASGSIQQLALQQQQLIQQLQLVQRQYVVHQGMGMQPLMLPQNQGKIYLEYLLKRILNIEICLREKIFYSSLGMNWRL